MSTLWRYHEFVIFVVLLALGYGFGRGIERRHFESLRSREQERLGMPVIAGKLFDPSWSVASAAMVAGSAAISIDYFKYAASSLRNFFGGRISAYESLLDRARREALLRMKDAAAELDASAIVGVHLQVCNVSGMKGGRGTRGVEVIAYGTALRLR